MEQRPIRDFNNQRYSKEEAAEIFKELHDRTKHNDPDYNSVERLGEKVKELNDASPKLPIGNYEGTAQTLKEDLDSQIASLTDIEFAGIVYDTLIDAQAVNPAPADGTLFWVSPITDADNAGVYSFDASEPNGTKFQREFIQDIEGQLYEQDLFNLEGFITKQAGSEGTFSASASYRATDFLKVEPNVNYKFKTSHTGNVSNYWYDSEKNPISLFTSAVVDTVVVSPANARYVRLSTKNSDIDNVKPYLKSNTKRLNIFQVLNIVNSFPPENIPTKSITHNNTNLKDKLDAIDDPMFGTKIVKDVAELLSINSEGDSDKAYPIGRKVYDQGLRSEVYADGCFWRMPDGSVATSADRVYVYPDWDEARSVLPTYASDYKEVFAANSLNNWAVEDSPAGTFLELSSEKGYNSVKITHASGTPEYSYFDNTTPIGLHDYLIFKVHANYTDVSRIRVGLLNAAGDLLFNKILDANDMGVPARPMYNEETFKVEIKVQDIPEIIPGSSLGDVTRIGFKVERESGRTASVWISNLETVSFKPMITLRFDDQRQSVYDNAYPLMNQYGFKGVIGVITGTPLLGNDPNVNNSDPGMTKAQLLEVRALGWDLVSHTHTHNYIAGQTDDFMDSDYKKSVAYLKDELGASSIERSLLISPFGQRDERVAKIQRKYYDAHIGGNTLISYMPRQPEGTWDNGSLWMDMGSLNGDNIDDGNDLIAHAQNIIDEKRWGIIMMHDILPTLANPNATTIQAFSDFMDWLDANSNLIDVVTIRDVVNKIRP